MRQPLLVFGLVSAASATVFEAINFPLGAMIGPIFAVAFLAHFTGINQKPGVDAHHFAILLIGIALGSQVTPDIVDRIQLWPASLLIMIICMVLILWLVGKLNQQLLNLDRISAHMAAAPGNLSSALRCYRTLWRCVIASRGLPESAPRIPHINRSCSVCRTGTS